VIRVMSQPRPNLYRGQPINLLALLALDHDKYEDFVYATLSEVGPLHGFKVVGGPAGSADAGFDVDGERLADHRRVAIQCKQLAGAFHLSMIGPELAKVALKAALEGYDIAEHFVIVASTAGESLRSALRERPRTTLAIGAAKAAENHPDLKTLREQALARGLNLRQTAEQYVHALEHIRVWTGRDYDQELGRVWSKILPTLERNFALEHVLHEQPRPDFDRSAHRRRCLSARPADQVELAAISTELPPNLLRTRGEDPLWSEREPALATLEAEDANLLEALRKTPLGTCTVLHGPGGSGKTNTLLSVQGVASEVAEEDEPAIPIFVQLSSYLGDLRKNIHEALGISNGVWTSLPGRFLLLLDGLDEIPFGLAQKLLDELAPLLETGRIAAVVTLRDTGLRSPVALRRFGHSLKLRPITFRQSIEIAQGIIPADRRQDFLDQLRARLRVFERELLLRPFGFATACKIFLGTGSLPADSEALLEGIFQRRLHRNRMRAQAIEERLREVPDSTIRKIAAQVAFEVRVQMQRASLDEEEWYAVVARAVAALKASSTAGISALSDLDVQVLLRHYELVDVLPEGRFRIVHDLLADLLAAPFLAARWEAHVSHLQQMVGSEVWLHAARLVPEAQWRAFLTTIYAIDPILAARCAKAIGPLATSLLEPLVLNDEARETPLSISQTSACMAILGTPTCLVRLQDRLASEPTDSKRYHQALLALAWHGDLAVLNGILAHEEPGLSSDFGISSGYLDAWWSGPPAAILSLARARIDASSRDPRIVLSLRTIQSFGDDTDLDRVTAVAIGSSSLATFYAAGNCLHALAPAYATRVFEAALPALPVKDALPFMEILSKVMQRSVDITPLLPEVLEGDPPWSQEAGMDRDRILKLVCEQELPAGWEVWLRSAYESADQYQRADLWQIATAHRLPAFDDLAFEIADRTDEFGLAANFAKVRSWSAEQQARFAELCKVRIASASGDEWFVARALEFLLIKGMRQDVATFVIHLLARFGSRHNEARRRSRERAQSRISERADDHEAFRLWRVIPSLVEIAEQIVDLLPASLKLEIVGYDLSMTGDPTRRARVHIASTLPPSEIDVVLSKITDAEDRIRVLSDLSELGSTPARVELLCGDLPRVLGQLALDRHLALAVDRLWSTSVAGAVVRAMATTMWPPPFGPRLARETIDVVAARITREIATSIVHPQIAEASNPESREIVAWWYELGMQARRGELDTQG